MRISLSKLCCFVVVGWLASMPASAFSDRLLVLDRLTNSVYSYGENGTLLGKVLTDNVNLNQPTGFALSRDSSKLYVTSSQNHRVVRYDFNAATATASNPIIFADASDGLATPHSVLVEVSGTIYVSNLGGTGVGRFHSDGAHTPPFSGEIGGGAFTKFSGMAFESRRLYVGAYQDSPAGGNGAVARSDLFRSELSDFIPASPAINGASGLLLHQGHLYVTGLLAGTLRSYSEFGSLNTSFNVNGLARPSGLSSAPDGNGLLVGLMGLTDGTGHIARYDVDGNLLGTFASPGGNGFAEATALMILTVPEPSGIGLSVLAIAATYVFARRRHS